MRAYQLPIAAAWCLALALAGPALAHAAETSLQPQSALISNSVLPLGVRGEAAIAGVGFSALFVPSTAAASSTGWNLGLPGTATSLPPMTVETFWNDGVTAMSVVRVEDPAVRGALRVTHFFDPFELTPNLYEVTVTVENVGAASTSPTVYRRQVSGLPAPGWTLQPGADGQGATFDLGLPSLAPGAEHVFRLYYSAANNEDDARSALVNAGASIVTVAPGQVALVFGYASGSGALAAEADGGSSGGSAASSAGKSDQPGHGSAKPDQPGNSPANPDQPDNGAAKPDQSGVGRAELDQSGPGSTKPDQPGVGPTKPDQPSDGPAKPDQPGPGSTKPDQPGPGATKPHPPLEDLPDLGLLEPPVFDAHPAETPELSAMALFGTGLAGMGSYALARWRTRRRPPTD